MLEYRPHLYLWVPEQKEAMDAGLIAFIAGMIGLLVERPEHECGGA